MQRRIKRWLTPLAKWVLETDMKFVGAVKYQTDFVDGAGKVVRTVHFISNLFMNERDRRKVITLTSGEYKYDREAYLRHRLYPAIKSWELGGAFPPQFTPEDVLLEMLNKMVQHKLTGDEL